MAPMSATPIKVAVDGSGIGVTTIGDKTARNASVILILCLYRNQCPNDRHNLGHYGRLAAAVLATAAAEVSSVK